MAHNLTDSGREPTPPFDPAEPLKGKIICCTSIPPDQRTSIANKIAELGGLHKYDLVPGVTHLIVGEYDTPKYRHVARQRPDVKAMDATWVEALSELWKRDEDIDFAALETEHQMKPLERRGFKSTADRDPATPATRDSLLICLTGFGDQRDEIAHRITANGGSYTGDLTRQCTHLIVNKPEGKKFAAAKAWGVCAVTLQWLDQTISRGMILEEARFDPMLPPEEQGKGAWITELPKQSEWGKRARSMTAGGEGRPRKLRKTASMKLNTQRNNLWGDILGRSTTREYSFAAEQEKPQAESRVEPQEPQLIPKSESTRPVQEPQGVFSGCYFFVHGFSLQRTNILEQTIATLGGSVCMFLYEAAIGPYPEPGEPRGRFLLVPQSSQPDTHPPANYENLHIVTEYYIERCMHNKAYFDPNEQVLGRPFPLFPIPGFGDLTVCSAAFTGIELNQVARSLSQLGANFQEEFRRGTSVLVCKSLAAIRKEKLRMALKWAVPVVSADWLWECISTGFKAPLEDFIFPELRKHYEAVKKQGQPDQTKPRPASKPLAGPEPRHITKPIQRARSETALRRNTNGGGIDTTAFDHDSPERPNPKPKPQPRVENPSQSHDTHASATFTTARTHPAPESFPQEPTEAEAPPLSEISSNRLNKSPSPVKQASTNLPRTHSEPTRTSAVACPSPPAEDAEAALKLKQHQAALEEEARNKAKAAERQALSSKLTSLIAPTASTGSDESPNDPNQGPLRPRRRQILGRAISNVSNASSDAARSDVLLRDFSEDREKEDQPPPATQLEYVDPQAQECKAALMSRMMNGMGPEVKTKAVQSSATVGGRTLRRR